MIKHRVAPTGSRFVLRDVNRTSISRPFPD